MAKQIRQFRFYDAGNSKNQPSTITAARLESGSIFFAESALGTITQLGIQSIPGTKFYLNSSTDPVIIGSTGIYELDLEGVSEITALSFDGQSLKNIANNSGGYIIVDAIYNAEEE